jgi:maltose alpha-D-glucosyltransferase/alpha-amylase
MAQGWGESGEEAAHAAPGGYTLARLRTGPRVGALCDAFCDDDFLLALLEVMRAGAVVPGSDGALVGHATGALARVELPAQPDIQRIGVEQSNNSAIIGDAVVVKLIRRPHSGPNPEVEMGRYLTETSPFANTPPLLGWLEWSEPAAAGMVLAVAHGFVRNQGDAWEWVQAQLVRYLDEASVLPADELDGRPSGLAEVLSFMAAIGRRTAGMHRALAAASPDPDFGAAPVDAADLSLWHERAVDQAQQAIAALRGSDLPEAGWLAAHADRLMAAIAARLPAQPFGQRIRIHGDYHLGQLLVAVGDVHVIDFEGEPVRAIAARRAKDSPLRDVAGIMRSLDYAGHTALSRMAAARPDLGQQLEPVVRDWQAKVSAAFLDAYLAEAGQEGDPLGLTKGDARRLLGLFVVEKACYEIVYEVAHRPAWLSIPVHGLITLLSSDEA